MQLKQFVTQKLTAGVGCKLSTRAAQGRKGRLHAKRRLLVCKAANYPSHPKSYASNHCMRCGASKMKEEYTPIPSNLQPSLTPCTHTTINQLYLPSNLFPAMGGQWGCWDTIGEGNSHRLCCGISGAANRLKEGQAAGCNSGTYPPLQTAALLVQDIAVAIAAAQQRNKRGLKCFDE